MPLNQVWDWSPTGVADSADIKRAEAAMVTSPDVIQNFPPGKTIRILFYCDHRDMNWEPVPPPGKGERLRRKPTEFGLRIAKDLLEAQSSLTLRFDVDPNRGSAR